jgi:2-oxoglutarate ferredoxin oxidoreductase subunit delta
MPGAPTCFDAIQNTCSEPLGGAYCMSKIIINEDQCKGCGLCTTVCPFDLIRIADRFNAKGYRPAEFMHSNGSVADDATSDAGGVSQQCTGCANCAAMCPDVAIVVYRSRSETETRMSARIATRKARRIDRATVLRHNRGNGQEQQKLQSVPECVVLSSETSSK